MKITPSGTELEKFLTYAAKTLNPNELIQVIEAAQHSLITSHYSIEKKKLDINKDDWNKKLISQSALF